jgi:hypothetical protein
VPSETIRTNSASSLLETRTFWASTPRGRRRASNGRLAAVDPFTRTLFYGSMARVVLTPELSARIAARIAAFPAENEAHQWLADLVRETAALPLWLDMGGSYGITAVGELVELDWDGPSGSKPLHDPRAVNLALFQGSLKFPELAVLVPTRPATATTCGHCGGGGKLALANEPGLENIVCYCGGLGWLP